VVETTSNGNGTPSEVGQTSHGSDSGDDKEQPLQEKYPGCFKKTLAFLIDTIIITVISVVAFFPFSALIESLGQHAWLPGYLLGVAYFAIIESSFFKSQSFGKMIFSLRVYSLGGESVSPLVSLGRYVLVTIPFFNGQISNTIASMVGVTDTFLGGILYMSAVAALFSGNTLFMLLHPQKRGLHDVLCKSIVGRTDHKPYVPVVDLSVKPVAGGIVGIAILVLTFGHLFYNVDKNPDFADLGDLTNKIREASSISNLNVSYRTFSTDGKQTMFAIQVHLPIPYSRFQDRDLISFHPERHNFPILIQK